MPATSRFATGRPTSATSDGPEREMAEAVESRGDGSGVGAEWQCGIPGSDFDACVIRVRHARASGPLSGTISFRPASNRPKRCPTLGLGLARSALEMRCISSAYADRASPPIPTLPYKGGGRATAVPGGLEASQQRRRIESPKHLAATAPSPLVGEGRGGGPRSGFESAGGAVETTAHHTNTDIGALPR